MASRERTRSWELKMTRDKSAISFQDVVDYITSHPDCLASHPDLLAQCLKAVKSLSDDDAHDQTNIVNLSPALAARARDEARRVGLAHKSLLHVAAKNMVSWQRLHHATLGLLASTDLAGLCHVISVEFPVIFDVEKSALIVEKETSLSCMFAAGIDVCPAAQIVAALHDQTLYLGTPSEAGTAIMGQAAPSMALIRLPDRLPAPVSDCVLLLAGKHETSFQPELGSDLLVLLAEMVGVTMAARLESVAEQT